MSDWDQVVTVELAYRAMVEYVRIHLERAPDSDVATLYADVALFDDGGSGDPAARDDWLTALEQVRRAFE